MPELTLRAVVLGVLMAVFLGAANAYLGLRAGLTVSATFPAAVAAMAVLRLVKGSVLEENIARTTGSVGEALVAGAIFTIPAFVISGAWSGFHYWESTVIMLVGGVLGVLFIILLRRPLVVESNLPFPESVATAEIVKAGQRESAGARYVFGSLGFAALIEFFKNSNGLRLFSESASSFLPFSASRISLLGRERSYTSGLYLESPSASPALIGVGFIVGPRIGSVLISGAMMGWFLLVPLGMFLNPDLAAEVAAGASWASVAEEVWRNQVRPLAVGTMIVAALHTLWELRQSLAGGIARAFRDLNLAKAAQKKLVRLDQDLDLTKIATAVGLCSVPLFALYFYSTAALLPSALLTVVMLLLGFLFAAVAGYLAGTIGGSNSPISGLTLSTLVIASLLMVLLGATGIGGVAAVLTVAGVVCCAAGVAGDMLQDLKVGHILGGTPWRMELAEIIGVVVASFVLVLPIMALHAVYGIGGRELPAPQAGLMALLAQGVVGGRMPWALVIMGMLFAIALIFLRAPSPMLIAVGMYLPFFSTAAIFIGGVFRWVFDRRASRAALSPQEKSKAENTGILLASGMVAGESLMAVLLALFVLGSNFTGIEFRLPALYSAAWPGLLVFGLVAYLLLQLP
ncbi:MAG: oligopeptide transporter, OPT family, partial [Acidobacteria bacterium]|nr:oligopeptide transporter, OPT family [Acidobacteriota bacterium]